MAIRFSAGSNEGLISRRLFDERLCAFCSPALASGKPRLSYVEDLQQATLIHWNTSDLSWAPATREWMDWRRWLHEVGAAGLDWRRGIEFSDYNLAVQAAVAGHGVVLGSLPILRDVIAANLLLDPFDRSVDPGIGYDIVATEQAMRRDEVRCFADWIIAETRG